MDEYEDHRALRDQHLRRRIRQSADNVRMALREWIQAELKESLITLQIAETSTSGPVQVEVRARIARLKDVDRRELRETEERFEARLRELGEDFSGDLDTVRSELEEALAAYDRLSRELLGIREALDTLASGQP